MWEEEVADAVMGGEYGNLDSSTSSSHDLVASFNTKRATLPSESIESMIGAMLELTVALRLRKIGEFLVVM